MADTKRIEQPIPFRPVLVDALKDYSGKKLLADVTAGVTVAMVAIPLAMAFAIASGMTPQAGLVTAIVAGFLISALGGSRYQIGGPTGAFVPILAAIVLVHGAGNLLVCTFMAGVMLFLMGASGLGKVIKYIPYPVTMGFTSGIAVIIFTGQIKDFLGLTIKLPAQCFAQMELYAKSLGGIDGPTLAVGAAVVAMVLWWPTHWQRRVPGSIVALIVATLVVKWLGLKVITIATAFPGGIPQGFPGLQWPDLHWQTIQDLMGSAMTVAMLGAIESLLSAVVADGLTNDRHDSNQELMAQGIANMCSPLFGGIPATGAIARTGTNIRCGAVSPVAGIVHSATLLVILLVAAPLANGIPLCALAGILLVVAFKMGEWHEFARLRRIPHSDALVFVTVFLLTVVMNLTWAVVVGMVLASLLFIKRVSETSEVTALDDGHPVSGERPVWADEGWPEGVYVFRVQGAFFFGTADMLETSLRRAGARLRVMILVCDDVFSMDATGLNALESLNERLRGRGGLLILCKVPRQPLAVLKKSGFLEELGAENLTETLDAALERARGMVEGKKED
jgi:SulP family sulfate permease